MGKAKIEITLLEQRNKLRGINQNIQIRTILEEFIFTKLVL